MKFPTNILSHIPWVNKCSHINQKFTFFIWKDSINNNYHKKGQNNQWTSPVQLNQVQFLTWYFYSLFFILYLNLSHLFPMESGRSLLSSTDSCWNPAESGQFPEFQRNQIWQRGLPNWFNDSDGILNGIQILLELFLELPGRNKFPEFNGTESSPFTTTHTMPSHAQIDCRCLLTINLGVVNNPKPYSLTTTIIDNAHPASPPHYRHQHPPPPQIVTSHPQWPQHPQHSKNKMRTPHPTQEQCHHAMSWNERAPTSCHVAHSDVATRRWTMTSFVVIYTQVSHPASTISSEMKARGQ